MARRFPGRQRQELRRLPIQISARSAQEAGQGRLKPHGTERLPSAELQKRPKPFRGSGSQAFIG